MAPNLQLKCKELVLAIRTKWLLKNEKVAHYNSNLQRANSFGVLYSYESQQKQDAVQKLIRVLKSMGKQPKILCYTTPQDKETSANLLYTFNHTCLPTFGAIKSDYITHFMATPFDYLFCLDLQPNAIINYLLATSKAKCRIGNFDEQRTSLFEIMVSFSKKEGCSVTDSLVAQMIYYVDLCKKNDS